MNPIEFPGLGLTFHIQRVAFELFGRSIYWYGIIIACGFLLAAVFCSRQAHQFGIKRDHLLDMLLFALPIGIICARIYYVVFNAQLYFNEDGKFVWKDAVAIWDGGIAIYGGIIGGVLTCLVFCRIRKIPFLAMADLAVLGLLIGQCIGRWGNFVNQEAFGSNTTLPWGMYSEGTRSYLMGSTVTVQNGVTIDPNLPVHPTFLYESLWCLVGFILLFRYIKKRKFNGDITLRYLIWYGAGRFWIEALRTDSLMLVPSIGLRVSQLLAGIAVVAGVAAEIYFTRKFKGKPLMVPLAMTAENKAAMKKLDGPIAFAGADTQLPASASRKEFVEKTERYNAEVKQKLEEQQKNH